MSDQPKSRSRHPDGLNHLVLNVRNLEESHRFWTEILGFKQVGELKATPQRPNPAKMRFYSGDHDGQMNHHDIALIENTGPARPAVRMEHERDADGDRPHRHLAPEPRGLAAPARIPAETAA